MSKAQSHDLTPVPGPSGIKAGAALEPNCGRAKALGIAVGDRIWLDMLAICYATSPFLSTRFRIWNRFRRPECIASHIRPCQRCSLINHN